MTDTETAKPLRGTDLMRAVFKQIDAYPDNWNQGSWASMTARPDPAEADPLEDPAHPACGTTACFAGWAVVLGGGRIDYSDLKYQGEDGDHWVWTSDFAIAHDGERDTIFNLAQKYLECDSYLPDTYQDLFNSYNTRNDLWKIATAILAKKGEVL